MSRSVLLGSRLAGMKGVALESLPSSGPFKCRLQLNKRGFVINIIEIYLLLSNTGYDETKWLAANVHVPAHYELLTLKKFLTSNQIVLSLQPRQFEFIRFHNTLSIQHDPKQIHIISLNYYYNSF